MNKPEEFGVSGKHIYTFPVKMAYWMKGSFEIRVYQQAKGLFALVQHFNTSGDTYVTKGICAGQVETRAAELYVGCLRNGAYFENNGMVPILNNYHFGKQYKIRSFSSTTDKEWQKSKLICEAGISDTFSVTKDPYGALEVESTVEYPVYYVRSELVAWIYNLEGEPSAVCEQASSGGYLLFDISFSETLNANLLKECHCRKAGIGRSLEVLKQNPSKIIRTPGVGLASAKIAQDAPFAFEVLDESDSRVLWVSGVCEEESYPCRSAALAAIYQDRQNGKHNVITFNVWEKDGHVIYREKCQ